MKYGLIGEKLGHSFSKEIHEKIALYEQIEDYSYELKEISRDNLKDFILGKSFKGINVTIPYKEMVIPYIDYVDEKALAIGAVNTIVNKNNKLYAYNTDYYGLKALINKLDINAIEESKVLVLGTGGTSKTAKVVLEDLGVKKIIFVSRKVNENDKIRNIITYDEVYTNHLDANIIINTTPRGMYPNDEEPLIDVKRFINLKGVVDVIYNPLKTRLIRDTESLNIKAVNGLYMLVAQAVFASNKFLDRICNDITIEIIYKSILASKQNIVLIGMPGCGKSTIGKELANALDKEYVDTDELIEKEINTEIKNFLSEENENEFRDIESKIVDKVSLLNNKIISTGGGVIKRKSNIKSLLANGIIIFIDRKIDDIKTDDSRPLSSNIEKLKKLYNERYQIYNDVCDYKIINDKEIEDALNEIINIIDK